MSIPSVREGRDLNAVRTALQQGARAHACALFAGAAPRIGFFRQAAFPKRLRAIIYAGAMLLLIAGVIIAFRALPENVSLEHPVYGWLVFAAIAPAIIVMNTLETQLSAYILGVRFGWISALRISVLSSAANVLPLPGGPVLRAAALKTLGVKFTSSGALISAMTTLWLGLVFIYAGGALTLHGNSIAFGVLFMSIGAISLAAAALWLRHLSCSTAQILLIGALKLTTSIIGVIGLWWTFALLGAFPGFIEVSVFSVSAISGIVVSFVPAGLGVTEIASAAMATMVSISPALAFLAAAAFRIIWLAFLLPLAAFFALTGARHKGRIL
ncbi:hypothetical protein [Hyphococcus luteus]|uniref:hypothetical protein n=1 Tax=Hyphococcus luteus TaxID=2058213 RepID=UPI0013FD4B29|nr:hypothetical protein [Marinicaulis flavus]